MDAMKNVLMLTSLIIGLAATAALAEAQTDVVFGPEAPTTEKLAETAVEPETTPTTETDEQDTADTDKNACGSKVTREKNLF